MTGKPYTVGPNYIDQAFGEDEALYLARVIVFLSV